LRASRMPATKDRPSVPAGWRRTKSSMSPVNPETSEED
jgi:hypothetical protein